MTRDQTQIPCSGSLESVPGPPGKFPGSISYPGDMRDIVSRLGIGAAWNDKREQQTLKLLVVRGMMETKGPE